MKVKLGDIVEVTWEDARSMHGWGPEARSEDWFRNGTAVVHTVGFLRHLTKKGVGVVSAIAEDGDTLALHFIPKGMVRKLRRLR